MTDQGAPRRTNYTVLTFMRFVLAVWVVVYHMWDVTPRTAPPWVHALVRGGPAAVSFFFVLSGFVLVVAYAPGAQGMTLSKRAYARARFWRLAPNYVLALLCALPIARHLARTAPDAPGAASWGQVVLAALGLQAWVPGAALAVNPPGWSLSVELAFSVVFVWLGPWVARRSTRQVAALGAVAACLAAATAVLALGLPGAHDPGAHSAVLNVAKYHPLVRAPEFAVGLAAGVLFTRGAVRVPAWLGVAACAAALTSIAAGLPWMLAHHGVLVPLWTVAILGFAAAGEKSGGLWRTGAFLGRTSYALYVMHVPLLWWLAAGARAQGRPVLFASPTGALLTVLVAVLSSALLYVVWERRWARFGRRHA